MPIVIPPFAQYQGVMIPLRGLWNVPPVEGDSFVNIEIDWGTIGNIGGQPLNCVQFAISGNSPVSFSQIVAFSVDNSRCGADIDFLFPDSGFVLTVPAHNQGVYPVFTNALSFYAVGVQAAPGDISLVQVLNSMPPPVAIQPAAEQSQIGTFGLPLPTNGTNPIIAPQISGTLTGFSMPYTAVAGAASGGADLQLADGTGKQLWNGTLYVPADGTIDGTFSQSGLQLRFRNGVQLVIANSTLAAGVIAVNLFYTVP